MNFNKLFLGGHLTRDPELSFLPSQTPVVECGIAANHKYKDKEDVCFCDFRIYGKQAEVFKKFMEKGRPVLLEGRLQFDQWEKDGQKRSKHRLIVDRFHFVDGGQKSEPQENTSREEDSIPF